VAGAAPKRGLEREPHHEVLQIYTLEAAGLMLIGAMIPVLTLARYWHRIPWSAH